jgi:hypothetical protein
MYFVIESDGELHARQHTPTRATLVHDVGESEPAEVQLSMRSLTAWVNDDGWAQGLPRNITGSVMLWGMGSTQVPYVGPIIITGVDVGVLRKTPVDVWEPIADVLVDTYTDVCCALGTLPIEVATSPITAEVRKMVNDVARHVSIAPPPTLRVLTGDDLDEALRRLNAGMN